MDLAEPQERVMSYLSDKEWRLVPTWQFHASGKTFKALEEMGLIATRPRKGASKWPTAADIEARKID